MRPAAATVRATTAVQADCAEGVAIDPVITAIFSSGPLACDVNSDDDVSAADLTATILALALPTATSTPIATPTPSPSPSAMLETPTPTASPSSSGWTFTDVTEEAGLSYSVFALGGVAAGDYDGDGWTDLFMGPPGPLLRNRGDGTFEEVPEAGGITVGGLPGAASTFADFDGDGWLDLFVSGAYSSPQLYRNRGDGTFEKVTSGITNDCNCEGTAPEVDHSASFGDYDRDGYLDLFLTHWGRPIGPTRAVENLWHNNGDGTFTDVTVEAGVLGVFSSVAGTAESTWTFTANFADINNDGWPDLLIAADFGTSRVFLNDHDGTFTDTTNDVISDENGMGAAVGDYDNDGNLDWFVSSIWTPETSSNGSGSGHSEPPSHHDLPIGITGNRLYRGLGDGTFEDVTEQAGVRRGYWGWGSCFADFNNDGHLDIFHVNGAIGGVDDERFSSDPSRLFIANGDGTFTERSEQLGIDDRGPGQGVVCFDYDGDGDIDIFLANSAIMEKYPPRLFRNDGGNQDNFLEVKLRGHAPNTEAIGARIYVTIDDQTQMRELRAGNNYVSQDPAVAHFGLGTSTAVDQVRVVWPDQTSTSLSDVAARQHLTIVQP